MSKDFDRPFYTIAQAAEKLNVHENTIRNLIKRGEVTYYRVGNQFRIAEPELERLKVERKTKEPEPTEAAPVDAVKVWEGTTYGETLKNHEHMIRLRNTGKPMGPYPRPEERDRVIVLSNDGQQ